MEQVLMTVISKEVASLCDSILYVRLCRPELGIPVR